MPSIPRHLWTSHSFGTIKAVILFLVVLNACNQTSSDVLRQEAYVWQRVWTPAVINAVENAEFDSLTVLAAEIEWRNDTPYTTFVKTTELPPNTGLAIRMAVPPVDPTPVLLDVIDSLLVQHPSTTHIQLDIDLPTSRLEEYVDWIAQIQRTFSVPVEVTALPTWIGAPAFSTLGQMVDRVILQVHWLDPNDPSHLLDPNALKHIQAASHAVRNLSVSLPTYGYQLSLNPNGTINTVLAEQRGVSSDTTLEVMADPKTISALVRSLKSKHPKNLTAIHWFRLPVEDDSRNWTNTTLNLVRQGLTPMDAVEVSATPDDGAWIIKLHNTGDTSISAAQITVNAVTEFADGVNGWRWSQKNNAYISDGGSSPMPPNTTSVVGWLRLKNPQQNPPSLTFKESPQ
jgi:hypothetical protein